MSDMVSVYSGPESEYDFNDLETGKESESGRGGSAVRKKLGLSAKKPV